jgi:lysine 2,3-aminomutase
VKSGIAVYVQTPFLNNCNDEGPELVRLFSLLRGAGAELHYIYIPCSPIHGNSIYWSPISKGLAVGNYLRAHLSDRVIPRICTATPIGKMDWHSSGWAVEPVAENENFMWIRTPYTPDYFKRFAPIANDLENIGSTMRAPLISSTWPRSAMNRSFWARVRQNLRWCSCTAGNG